MHDSKVPSRLQTEYPIVPTGNRAATWNYLTIEQYRFSTAQITVKNAELIALPRQI
jgi:hypothetical protein